jgi:hypothetical protein
MAGARRRKQGLEIFRSRFVGVSHQSVPARKNFGHQYAGLNLI